MLNGLDLFSGIGGMSLGLKEWVRPIAYCEIDPYCQGVLLSRMAKRELSKAPIYEDICGLTGLEFAGDIHIIYGGFPCQDISIAGLGKGLAGERSGLFFEILRLAKEIKPRLLFIENVPAICTRGGLKIVNEIASLGYDCRWCVISAASVGARHKRERWFLLAHTNDNGLFTDKDRASIRKCSLQGEGTQKQTESIRKTERASCISGDVAHAMRERLPDRKEIGQKQITQKSTFRDYGDFDTVELWQETVSRMDKCADGISCQVDRIRALGNAVVPCQAREAFKILMGLK